MGLRTNGTSERIHAVWVPALPVVLVFTSHPHNAHVGLSLNNSPAAQQLGMFLAFSRGNGNGACSRADASHKIRTFSLYSRLVGYG